MAYTHKDHDEFSRPTYVYSKSATNKLDRLTWTNPNINDLAIEDLIEEDRQVIISAYFEPAVPSLNVYGRAGYKSTEADGAYQVAYELDQDQIYVIDVILGPDANRVSQLPLAA